MDVLLNAHKDIGLSVLRKNYVHGSKKSSGDGGK